jgi:hypothetical protein
VLSAENLLIHILRRAKYLSEQGEEVFGEEALQTFLKGRFTAEEFRVTKSLQWDFAQLDDTDIFYSIKMWTKAKDRVLSVLSRNLVNRHLPKIEIQNAPFDQNYVDDIVTRTRKTYNLSADEVPYFVFTDEVANNAYNPVFDKIGMLYHDGSVADITKSSDQINTELLSRTIRKYFLCYPKEV